VDYAELANLLLRWFHVFAGILWIGQTWLFTWLDLRFENAEENPGGRVYMVHSGGFYVVEKKKALDAMPKTLHWFKWEAGLTWLSGLLLLILVYDLGGLIVPGDSSLDSNAAALLGLAALPVAWIVYDTLWRAVAGRAEGLGIAISYGLIVASAYGLMRVFSERAAWMHVGAMLGTLMAWNVWVRIIPGQRAMTDAIAAGREPDLAMGALAKQRSKHNSFIVMPLVLIMLSNHFPTITYGARYSWAVLGGFVLLGWAIAAVARKR
jgi:uncharacterized membrane protein